MFGNCQSTTSYKLDAVLVTEPTMSKHWRDYNISNAQHRHEIWCHVDISRVILGYIFPAYIQTSLSKYHVGLSLPNALGCGLPDITGYRYIVVMSVAKFLLLYYLRIRPLP